MEQLDVQDKIASKWSELIEATDVHAPIKQGRKRITAVLLENTEKEYLKEANNLTTGIDNVDPVLINLVRRTAPNLLAYDLVGVQPMTGPTGLVFAMRAFYGAQPQGPHGRPGDARTGFTQGDTTLSSGLTNAQVNGLNGIATGEAFKNEANTAFSGTGTQSANDGSVEYADYSVATAMGTGAGEILGATGSFGQMSFTIEKVAVEAQTRALATEYSHELAQDLKSVHGLDAETELTNILSVEIVAEINREIVNRIRQVAKIATGETVYNNGVVDLDTAGAPVVGTAGVFDLNTNTDGRWSAEKYKALLYKIEKEANAIAKDTRRGRGNFIICSSNVASALALSGKLVYAPAQDANLNVDDTGNTFAGVLLGRFKVYIDPYVGYDEIIVGYKGNNEYDAGFFYCPYVPLQLFKTTDPATFQPKMAFKTRYGVVANPFTTLVKNQNSYFRKFRVTGL